LTLLRGSSSSLNEAHTAAAQVTNMKPTNAITANMVTSCVWMISDPQVPLITLLASAPDRN
jgi:hypothetical protein